MQPVAKNRNIGSIADMGKDHVERHQKSNFFLQENEQPILVILGDKNATGKEILEDAFKTAQKQGMLNSESEFGEWKEKRIKKQGKSKAGDLTYRDYTDMVSRKAAVSLNTPEKNILDRNKGLLIDSGLYYVMNTTDYLKLGLIEYEEDEQQPKILKPAELAKVRKFEEQALIDYFHSDTYKALHEASDFRVEIHRDEEGAIHGQTLAIMGQEVKRGRGKAFEITPTKEKSDRLEKLLGENFEKELRREAFIHNQRKKLGKDDNLPTRAKFSAVTEDEMNSSEITQQVDNNKGLYVQKLWWRVQQDKIEDLAIGRAEALEINGEPFVYERNYGTAEVKPTLTKKNYVQSKKVERTHYSDLNKTRSELEKSKSELVSIKQQVNAQGSKINALRTQNEPLKLEFHELHQENTKLSHEIRQKHKQMSSVLEKGAKVDIKKLNVKYQMKNIEVPTGEQDLFGREKTETKKERTGNLIIPEAKFSELISTLNETLTVQSQLKSFSKTDFVEEVKQLKKDNAKLNEIHEQDTSDYKELFENHKELRTELTSLRNEISHIYQGVKDFFKERTETAQQAWGFVGDLVDKVRGRVSDGAFEDNFKHEIRKNNERGGPTR